MKILDENFSLGRYGLKVRLVNESDAEFILSLRTNPNRTKFMITLDNEIENQIRWIQEYKEREREGLDYYFIYSKYEGRPIGLNRISHVDFHTKTGKASSWIAIEGLKYEPITMLLLGNEIVFNSIGLEMSWGEVHKNNNRVIKIFKLFGYKVVDTETEYCNFTLQKNDFLDACKNSILSRIKTTNK